MRGGHYAGEGAAPLVTDVPGGKGTRLPMRREIAPSTGGPGLLPAGIPCYVGPCGWMVSPRASISTNCLIRLALVSSLFAVPMR